MLKRPLASIGFLYLFVLLILMLSGMVGACGLAGCSLLALVFVRIKHDSGKRLLLICASCMAAVISYCTYTYAVVYPTTALVGRSGTVQAQILDITKTQNSYYYKLRIVSFDQTQFKRRILAGMYQPQLLQADYYDVLTVDGSLERIANDGVFQKAKGVFLTLKPTASFNDDEQVTSPRTRPLRYHLLVWRNRILTEIGAHLSSNSAGLVKGIVLGDTTEISAQDMDTFAHSGIRHMLTVSGFHVAMVLQLFQTVLSVCRAGRRTRLIVGVIAVFGFVALCGFGVSSIRAAVMAVAACLSTLVHRRADQLTSLGLGALLLTVWSPYSAADLGLLLSFCSTLGIILFCRRIEHWITNKLRLKTKITTTLCSYLSCSLAALIGVLPITVLAFGEVSIVGPVCNMLATPLVTTGLIFGLATGVAGVIPGMNFVAGLFGWVADRSVALLLHISRLFERVPYSYLQIDQGDICTILLPCAALLVLHRLCKDKRAALRLVAGLCPILVITSIGAQVATNYNVLKIAAVAGNFEYNIVVSKNGKAIIFNQSGEDSALARATRAYLERNHIRTITQYVTLGSEMAQADAIALYAQSHRLERVLSLQPDMLENLLGARYNRVAVDLLENKASCTLGDMMFGITVDGKDFACVERYGNYRFALGNHYGMICQVANGQPIDGVFAFGTMHPTTQAFGRQVLITIPQDCITRTPDGVRESEIVELAIRKNGNSIIDYN